MPDIWMLALAAVLGAVSSVLAGIAFRAFQSARDKSFAKQKTKEERKMAKDTEAAQSGGTTVIMPLGGVIQIVASTPTTAVANAELPEPTRSYTATPVLISPKLQVSQQANNV